MKNNMKIETTYRCHIERSRNVFVQRSSVGDSSTTLRMTKDTINKILIYARFIICLMGGITFNTQGFAQKIITETFEDASGKGLYPIGKVNTPLGTWTFDGALVTANEPTDFRPKAPRMLASSTPDEPAGSITSDFDIPNLKSVKVGFIGFKADPGYFQIEVSVSRDKGKTWESLGTSRGRYDKAAETFATFQVKDEGKKQSYRLRISNDSAPRLTRFNRINLTLVEIEYGK